MAKVCICGSRAYHDMDQVRRYVQTLEIGTVLIVGRARGVDLVAENEGKRLGLEILPFPALWGAYGKRAGPIRNRQMIEAADQVVAFWDGLSRGTLSTIEFARQAGKPLLINPKSGGAW